MPPGPALDAYLICATPRTGSTLLCGLLESAGVAGHPASYFNGASLDAYAESWGVPRPSEGGIDPVYIRAAISAGSTPNGVFGVRVMGETMPQLIHALAVAAPHAGSELDSLTTAFGPTRFVHLWRADVVAQAVSWARAEQTHFWHPGEAITPGAVSPRYDPELIDRLVTRIVDLDAAWRTWFDAQGLAPLEIEYEDLAADPTAVAHRTLDFLGLSIAPGQQLVIGHHRQADELNVAWIDAYRSSLRRSATE